MVVNGYASTVTDVGYCAIASARALGFIFRMIQIYDPMAGSGIVNSLRFLQLLQQYGVGNRIEFHVRCSESIKIRGEEKRF